MASTVMIELWTAGTRSGNPEEILAAAMALEAPIQTRGIHYVLPKREQESSDRLLQVNSGSE